MGDDDRRALAHHAAQARQDFLFGVGVHRRQGVVQNQDRRIDQQGARERGALLLAAGERQAALADHRLPGFREGVDVFIEARDFGGGQHGVEALGLDVRRLGRGAGAGRQARARARRAERDVLGDGLREQERLLRHHADGAAEHAPTARR